MRMYIWDVELYVGAVCLCIFVALGGCGRCDYINFLEEFATLRMLVLRFLIQYHGCIYQIRTVL